MGRIDRDREERERERTREAIPASRGRVLGTRDNLSLIISLLLRAGTFSGLEMVK